MTRKALIPAVRYVFDELTPIYGFDENVIDVCQLFSDVAEALIVSGEMGSSYERERSFIESELVRRLGQKVH